MEKQEITSVVFDYTSFLGASCKKKWTFFEIVTSIAPVFGSVWKSRTDELREPQDRLWEDAFNTLSTQSSDESNLIRLVNLAKQQGIDELKLMMPYELDEEQVKLIAEKTDSKIVLSAQDEFTISI